MRSNLFVGNYVVEITVPLRNFGFGFGAALQFEFEARLPLSQLFSCQTFNSSQAFSTEARICTNVSDSKILAAISWLRSETLLGPISILRTVKVAQFEYIHL